MLESIENYDLKPECVTKMLQRAQSRSPLERDRELQSASPELIDMHTARQRQIMELHLSLNQHSPAVCQLFCPRVW